VDGTNFLFLTFISARVVFHSHPQCCTRAPSIHENSHTVLAICLGIQTDTCMGEPFLLNASFSPWLPLPTSANLLYSYSRCFPENCVKQYRPYFNFLLFWHTRSIKLFLSTLPSKRKGSSSKEHLRHLWTMRMPDGMVSATLFLGISTGFKHGWLARKNVSFPRILPSAVAWFVHKFQSLRINTKKSLVARMLGRFQATLEKVL
jgi:hypothetical protein